MKLIIKEIDPGVNYLFVIKTQEDPAKAEPIYKARINEAMRQLYRAIDAKHGILVKRAYGSLTLSGPDHNPLRIDKQYLIFGLEELETAEADHMSKEEREGGRENFKRALLELYKPEDLPGRIGVEHFYNTDIEILDLPGREFYQTPEEQLLGIEELYPDHDVIPQGEGSFILLDKRRAYSPPISPY